MRGFVDTRAADVVAGDTLIEPTSGVLCKVESVENEGEMIALHMRGSVSLSYMGFDCKPDRVLRIAPRAGHVAEVPASPAKHVPVSAKVNISFGGAGLCLCGKRLQRECVDECIR